MPSTRGRCLCGEVRFTFDPAGVVSSSHCHCESCRRACSAPMTSFLSIRNSAWRWTGAEPQAYASSPGVTRYFCGACGSPMGYAGTACPDETDFFAASLENPADFVPEAHSFWSEKLPWLHLNDRLPRHSGDIDASPIAKPAKRR